MKDPTVERFMTPVPVTIGLQQTLDVAHRLMNDHGIRHLPVLDGGRLAGMLSQRDVHFIETLQDVVSEEVTVAEAMSPDTFTVNLRASIREVAATMAERKLGSAVVVDERDRVIGVFTTTDALRALAAVLAER